jgi:hypothetical protein
MCRIAGDHTRGREMPFTATPGTGNDVAHPPVASLTLQFLVWVAHRPRSYAETMDAWRTSCPRFTIWEDALGDGLVQVEPGRPGQGDARVVLTTRGRALLDQA